MRIVGIDASTNKTGVSLFVNEEYKEHVLIDLHYIKNSKVRLPKMMQEIKNTLDEYEPDLIVMEESLMKNNIAAVKLLSYLAGAIISWSEDHNVEFMFQLPTEWRKKIGFAQGKKRTRDELKKDAIDMVKKTFGLAVTDDEAEAILLGYSVFYKEETKIDDDIEIEI